MNAGKIAKKAVKARKQQRKEIRSILNKLESKLVPMNNRPANPRHVIICELLELAKAGPTNPSVIKAALEVYSYNDRLAIHILTDVAEIDYKELINKAKRGG